MDLRSLATFVQVAESKSFTRAGEILGYAQPTVSFHIKQLEQELNLQLFDRIGHTVALTGDGRAVLAYAQQICRLTQEMAVGAHTPSQPVGTVRLAMADSLCTPLLEKHLADFRRQYPQICLQVATGGTDALFHLLDHNEADIVYTLDAHVYTAGYVISNEEKIGVHFVCSAAHPLAELPRIEVRQLLQEPFLLTEKGMSYRRLMEEKLAGAALELQPVLEIGSADLLCRLVAQGVGLSFLPDYVTEAAVQAGQVVRLPVQDFEVELWKQLLYRREKWLSLPIRAVLDHFSAVMLAGDVEK